MKLFTITALLFISFIGISQVSYDFSEALPPKEKTVLTVNNSLFGEYQSSNGETFYDFKEDGVWIISTMISSISRETIRESSKYTVRNGYIFGVVADDSLPCELEGERYYFGMRNKEQIIGGSSKNILKKIDQSTYVINFYENGGYTPSLFTFTGKNLSVQHFDYETGTTLFESIENQSNKKVENMNYITLTPTEKEFSQIGILSIFSEKIIYIKSI